MYDCCAAVCCNVSQRVAVCCSVLQCVAVCCSVLVAAAETARDVYVVAVLHCVAMRYSVKRDLHMCKRDLYTWQLHQREQEKYMWFVVAATLFQGVAVYCRVLQGVAVRCSTLQCVAMCCSAKRDLYA